MPFSAKLGSTLNGYRIGTYVAERLGARAEQAPPGFVQIEENEADLPLTKHLLIERLPVARRAGAAGRAMRPLDVRLLDKIELVVAR